MFIPLEILAFGILFLMIFTGKRSKEYKWKRFVTAAVIMAILQVILIVAGILITDEFFHIEDSTRTVVLAAILISGFFGMLISGRLVKAQ